MEKKKKYLALLSLSLSGGAIYTLPYLKYVFYDQMISVMGVSNASLGFMMSMYSIGGIILYIPGGILADKVSSKKSIILSLVMTSILGGIYAVTFNPIVANIVWLLLSMTTAFVFWCSLMKAIALVGGDEDSGKMYGLYYGGAGLIRGACNAIALFVFTKFTNEMLGFRMAIAVLCGLNILAALMVLKFYNEKEGDTQEASSEEKFDMKVAKEIVKQPLVWLVSIAILCAYSLYSTVSYFTPYLSDVVGISENLSSTISIVRTNFLLVLCAPLGGYIVDKLKSTTKWFMMGGALGAILFVVILILPPTISPMLSVGLTLLIAGVGFMIYGVGFSIVTECKFPQSVTATVIGISSIVGFLPDLYMHSLSGYFIDAYGKNGYDYIFIFLLVICLISIVTSYAIRKILKKKEEEQMNI